MDTLELRVALRGLRRARGFTAAALLALGLGIGATAAVYTLVEAVVLRPLPYADPGRLTMLWERDVARGLPHERMSPVNFLDYRRLDVFADAAAWWTPRLSLDDETTGGPVRVEAVEASENLFRVLGVGPLLGPGFDVDSTLHDDASEVVVSHRLWRTRYAGDPAIVGRVLRLDGTPHTIVGVMPAGFDFPARTDVWKRLRWDLAQHSRGAHFMEGVARLRPGASLDGANRALAALSARLGAEHASTNRDWNAFAVALDAEVAGLFRPGLLALLGASGLLLLIACINVANLMLARATTRRREVALRAAVGAGRARLLAPLLAESALLAAGGSLLGLALAAAGVRALLAWSPVPIPRADEVALRPGVLLFTVAAAVATTLLAGLAPAMLVSATDLQRTLRDGGRGTGTRGRRTRAALVVAEMALAVVLLAGAGLLIRTVAGLLSEQTGVVAAGVATTDVQLPATSYREWPRVAQAHAALLDALRADPAVAAVGAGNFLPLAAGWRMPVRVPGTAAETGEPPEVQLHSVDDGWFGALGVPIVRGRGFGPADGEQAVAVVVVNEAFARAWFGGAEAAIGRRVVTTGRNIGPLGRRLTTGDEHTIVGVVRDVKNTSLREPAEPALYFSHRQFPFRAMHLVVRARGGADAASLVAAHVRRLDPALPRPEVTPLARVLAESTDTSRLLMLLMTAFAALALALGAVGTYGVISYGVAQRRQEMAVRLALGARPAAVLGLVLRDGVALAALGCALGVGGALVAGRALDRFLYGVTPWDAPTLGVVVLVVLATATAAALLPGRRAALEDPSRALRAE